MCQALFGLSVPLAQIPSAISGASVVVVAVVGVTIVLLFAAWLTMRFIPNHSVGVVEKLWSAKGSVPEGQILALDGEAGFQADVLRGGIHFGYWRWQYRVHLCPLVTVPQGKIGYVYARDGQPLAPSQTLGHAVACNNYQDARAFLKGDEKSNRRGQRGRQLVILREGVYAINPALFVVITEDAAYSLRSLLTKHELATVRSWQEDLAAIEGFAPVVIGQPVEALNPLHPEEPTMVD